MGLLQICDLFFSPDLCVNVCAIGVDLHNVSFEQSTCTYTGIEVTITVKRV
jgi:hypothetical protein